MSSKVNDMEIAATDNVAYNLFWGTQNAVDPSDLTKCPLLFRAVLTSQVTLTAVSTQPTSTTVLSGQVTNKVVASEPSSRRSSASDTSSSNRKSTPFWKAPPSTGGAFLLYHPQFRGNLTHEPEHRIGTPPAPLDRFGSLRGPQCPCQPTQRLARAWYKGPATVEPVRTDGWVGSVAEGGAVNFRDITFNPHAHGTHTETREHIHDAFQPVDARSRSAALPFLLPAYLVHAMPEHQGEDWVVPCARFRQSL